MLVYGQEERLSDGSARVEILFYGIENISPMS